MYSRHAPATVSRDRAFEGYAQQSSLMCNIDPDGNLKSSRGLEVERRGGRNWEQRSQIRTLGAQDNAFANARPASCDSIDSSSCRDMYSSWSTSRSWCRRCCWMNNVGDEVEIGYAVS